MEDNHNTLMEQLTRAFMLLHRYHHINRRGHGSYANPHRGQGRILSLLKMQPEISQKELAYLLDMRSQSLSELLAKLEKSGYITRCPSESDRRVMNIKLTEAGSEAAGLAQQQKDGTDQLFDCLNEQERENLRDYLGRIIDTLEKQPGMDSPGHKHNIRSKVKDCFDDRPDSGHRRHFSHHHGFGRFGRHGFSHGDHNERASRDFEDDKPGRN